MGAFDKWPAIRLAMLGALSGMVGSYFPGPSIGEAPGLGLFMILTGVWFALVVAYGVWEQGLHSSRTAAIAGVVAWAGWECAVNLAVQMDQRWLDPIGLSEAKTLALSGIAAGALGAAVTWAGVAAAVPALRKGQGGAFCSVVGGCLGALLALTNNLDYPAVLFVPWQAASRIRAG